ncbi:nuclear transport factor 2 family protein [Gordonia sp. HY002]|uniref:nuclear transport factor 2 family protein n=1 Tax=Gordonia zhenghanii TaxID=2911516 RepID=UPI001EF0E084|nr:nuclear transport factor 2 family protein [Gordonia zhenghanii]MCF8570210.1 nuclear transport factor 2 family protein [Gordonia zhenghanii]MCF8608185.1 nuclear transport factor 2 family protein [Gordonia zhenghanii]
MPVAPATAEAARETLYRYARAVDSADEAELAACLHPDAVLHRSDGARTGRDEVLAFYRTVFAGPTSWSKHFVSNISCTGDDSAVDVHAYFQAAALTDDGFALIFGEYNDTLVADGSGSLLLSVKSIDVQQSVPLGVPT